MVKTKDSTSYQGLAAIGIIVFLLFVSGKPMLNEDAWLAYLAAFVLIGAMTYGIVTGKFSASIKSKSSYED